MRLRRPCQHDRYDDHFPPNENLPGWEHKYGQMGYERETKGWFWCPGGEFLPEDALVVEKVEGEWPKWSKTVIHSWFYGDASKGDHPATALLDALAASQVGEPET